MLLQLIFLTYILSQAVVVLDSSNTLFLRGAINNELSNNIIKKIHSIEDDTIVLYIKSPGGSVQAGNRIVQVMDAMTANGKDIVCIAEEAYSMAFIIFQACATRYVMSSSVLMQHQMALMTVGQIERIRSQMKMYESVERELNQRQADRLQMSLKEFEANVSNDWWMYGSDIMKNKAADRVIHAMCSNNFRKCPLYF